MKIGFDEWAKATLKQWQLIASLSISLDEDATIKELEKEGTYKYLNINENIGT